MTKKSNTHVVSTRWTSVSDSTPLQTLGTKLQKLREEQGLTLGQLSKRASVSTGFLSQIERGLGNPSFEFLLALASALKVPVASFFSALTLTDQVIVRRNHRKRLTLPDRNLSYELLTPDLNRDLEMIWLELPAGVSTKDQAFSHQGEECGIILKGKLEAHVGTEVHVLEPGDSISIRCILPHWYCNPGPEDVVAVWAITPPSF